jgi:hypothetical protein
VSCLERNQDGTYVSRATGAEACRHRRCCVFA